MSEPDEFAVGTIDNLPVEGQEYRYCVKIFDEWHFCKVSNIQDLIMTLSIYYGVDSQLFRKALVGCETDEDYILMYNVFSGYGCIIEGVLYYGKCIYGDKE